MNKVFARVSVIGSLVMAPVVLAASAMAVPYDPTTDIGTAVSGLGTQIGTTITTALPYAVGLFAAVIGWRYVRKFIH